MKITILSLFYDLTMVISKLLKAVAGWQVKIESFILIWLHSHNTYLINGLVLTNQILTLSSCSNFLSNSADIANSVDLFISNPQGKLHNYPK